MSSRWQDIYDGLKSNGVDVYPPGTKTGEAKSKYVVVAQAETIADGRVSSSITRYYVMCYVPKNSYSQLAVYVDEVKEKMDANLWPMMRPDHQETPPFYDESVKAWMVSISYINYRKNRRS